MIYIWFSYLFPFQYFNLEKLSNNRIFTYIHIFIYSFIHSFNALFIHLYQFSVFSPFCCFPVFYCVLSHFPNICVFMEWFFCFHYYISTSFYGLIPNYLYYNDISICLVYFFCECGNVEQKKSFIHIGVAH